MASWKGSYNGHLLLTQEPPPIRALLPQGQGMTLPQDISPQGAFDHRKCYPQAAFVNYILLGTR